MTIRPLAVCATLIVLGLCGCYVHVHLNRPDYSLPGAAHPQYDITDIGPGSAEGINNKGQIVGTFNAGMVPNSYFTNASGVRLPNEIMQGFLWDDGKRIKMPTFGGWDSEAAEITDQGKIIGAAEVPESPRISPTRHKCFWDGTNLMDLEADPRFRSSQAIHITASGAVYVVSPPPGSKWPQHLWLYPAGFWPGVGQDIGIIGGNKITVRAINDNGMVIGTYDTARRKGARFADHHAFVWSQGKMTDLGAFGGDNSEAQALNNAGQVVGSADTSKTRGQDGSGPPSHAFLWDKGKMHDLGTLPGGNDSATTAINEKGQIIGASNFSAGNPGQSASGPGRDDVSMHPVIWEGGQIKDLTRLIPARTNWSWMDKPTGINNQGQIVGQGDIQGDTNGPITVIAGGAGNGYLLTPR